MIGLKMFTSCSVVSKTLSSMSTCTLVLQFSIILMINLSIFTLLTNFLVVWSIKYQEMVKIVNKMSYFGP